MLNQNLEYPKRINIQQRYCSYCILKRTSGIDLFFAIARIGKVLRGPLSFVVMNLCLAAPVDTTAQTALLSKGPDTSGPFNSRSRLAVLA